MSKLLTPQDLRNPKRPSGYNYVSRANSTGAATQLWCAKKGRFNKGTAATDWHGPCRQDPRQAAQDYCDYVNGKGIQLAPTLNSAGHTGKRDSLPSDPEVQAALGVLKDAKAQRKGVQGYVYCIGVEGDITGVKVGYSTKPPARVAELQPGNPRKLVLLGYIKGTETTERTLHKRFIKDNLIGEWFVPTGELLAQFGIMWATFIHKCAEGFITDERKGKAA